MDGGVDILARERIENHPDRTWFIQCRRYSSASKTTLRKAVNDLLKKVNNPPEVLLVVVACDVSRNAHDDYLLYAHEKGVSTPLLWTASVLEARLHAERRDLLFSYFGISEASDARHRESTVTRNLAIKKRLRKEFLKDPKEVDWEKVRTHPPNKFSISEVIIHSIDDDSYPGVDSKRTGISGWFKLEIWNFYHNGIEFVLRVEHGIMDEKGRWSVIEYGRTFDTNRYQEIKMFRLARIPFRNIVDVDTIGDEYYSQPHIYCRFANGGEPYEGFCYVLIDDQYQRPLDPDMQFHFRPPSSRN